jgi:hypothetical protein
MLALLTGAGFSYWAAGLPLARELFDFQVVPFGPRELNRLKQVGEAKQAWDHLHPDQPPEAFIAYAMQRSISSRRAVLWYIVRRLSEPYIWYEHHAFRWRRHVLMIDENRADDRPGVRAVRQFISRLFQDTLAGVLTTNYDLLVEYALGTKHFNYGLPGETLTGRGPYPVSQWRNPVRLTGRTPLAKVHGSISWDRHRRYTDGRRGLTGDALIVAPTPDKRAPPELLREWESAGTILRASDRLIVFGFGFNEYDTAFLTHLHEHGIGLRHVMLVDVRPKEDAARRIWPNAEIRGLLPPPDGQSEMEEWLATTQR